MIIYKDYEKQVYDWLMQKHEVDPSFTFSLRQNASKGTELDYFIGEPLGLNMDNKNLIVDAVLAQMNEGMRRYRYEESIENRKHRLNRTRASRKIKDTYIFR